MELERRKEREPGKRQCMSVATTDFLLSHSVSCDHVLLIAPFMLCLFPAFVMSLII